jgi:hypothetical protein
MMSAHTCSTPPTSSCGRPSLAPVRSTKTGGASYVIGSRTSTFPSPTTHALRLSTAGLPGQGETGPSPTGRTWNSALALTRTVWDHGGAPALDIDA